MYTVTKKKKKKGDKKPSAFLSFLIAGRADPRGNNQRSLGFLAKSETINSESTVSALIYAPDDSRCLARLFQRHRKPTSFSIVVSQQERASESPHLIYESFRSSDTSFESPLHLTCFLKHPALSQQSTTLPESTASREHSTKDTSP